MHEDWIGLNAPSDPVQFFLYPEVYVHVTVRSEEEDLLYSTRSQYGGNGQPLVFMIEKGLRPPRAWEISLKSQFLRLAYINN